MHAASTARGANFTVKPNVITLIEVQMMKFVLPPSPGQAKGVVRRERVMQRTDNCFMASERRPFYCLKRNCLRLLPRHLRRNRLAECKWLVKFKAIIFALIRYARSLVCVCAHIFFCEAGFSLIIFHILSMVWAL